MQLIAMAKKDFTNYPSDKLNKIWLSYLINLNEVTKHPSDNKYKTPHMNKRKLERKGRLLLTFPVFIEE